MNKLYEDLCMKILVWKFVKKYTLYFFFINILLILIDIFDA